MALELHVLLGKASAAAFFVPFFSMSIDSSFISTLNVLLEPSALVLCTARANMNENMSANMREEIAAKAPCDIFDHWARWQRGSSCDLYSSALAFQHGVLANTT